ncbi:hypothetical protein CHINAEXTREME_17235 [Halobiforma lacisalsi AJ5]|uniref:Uncharacterized protein n=1 Tax=Natronobacterium lacisalsi AJ5 TaxID=358396 RepID=M0LP18_NATLA|nr:hypothetical protein [Halobiforma lacisalsi]APW99406.1 hypothetical protein CHINAEXTREME_17235 [Halobiforma lacisalsi AJ5]EMA35292.1 hypothetical protein C445_05548 [Halobiforma lacisalsi AJ5]
MVQVDFETKDEALEAYYGEDSDQPGTTNDGTGPGESGRWAPPEQVPTDWIAGWTLTYQAERDDSEVRRYFVTRLHPETGQFQALTIPSGQVEDYADDTPLDELPHSSREDDAREAYQTWLEENDPEPGAGSGAGSGNGDDESPAWGEWQRVDEAAPWWIWGRDHLEEDRSQFLIAGESDDGSAVYLNGAGEVVDEPAIFETIDEVQAALEAYFQRTGSGDVPDDRRPTGNSPAPETIGQEASEAGADSSGNVSGKKLLAGAALVGTAIYLYNRGENGE